MTDQPGDGQGERKGHDTINIKFNFSFKKEQRSPLPCGPDQTSNRPASDALLCGSVCTFSPSVLTATPFVRVYNNNNNKELEAEEED